MSNCPDCRASLAVLRIIPGAQRRILDHALRQMRRDPSRHRQGGAITPAPVQRIPATSASEASAASPRGLITRCREAGSARTMRLNIFAHSMRQSLLSAPGIARRELSPRDQEHRPDAIFERRFARGGEPPAPSIPTSLEALLAFLATRAARRAGVGPEIRCRACAVVHGRADRDLGDGPVLDAGVLANGRRGAGGHRAGLCRAVRRGRTLSLDGAKASHPRRALDRGRGVDDPARGLRRAGQL